jgi:hypothetical protein
MLVHRGIAKRQRRRGQLERRLLRAQLSLPPRFFQLTVALGEDLRFASP